MKTMTPERFFEITTYIKNRTICNGFKNWMDREDEHFTINQTFNFYGKRWEEIHLQYRVARTPDAKTYAEVKLFIYAEDCMTNDHYSLTDKQHKILSDLMHRLWGE
jgi:hypothetical protein